MYIVSRISVEDKLIAKVYVQRLKTN